MNGKSWRSDSNGYPHICDHGRLSNVIADTVRHRPKSGTGNVDQKPEVKTGSGNCFGVRDVGRCRHCHQLVGLSRKCGVCRWDFADISFHSRDPVYFLFTVRHLEFRKFLESDNVGNSTVESGMVENRGVAVGISFLCGLELEIWVGVILPPPPWPY